MSAWPGKSATNYAETLGRVRKGNLGETAKLGIVSESGELGLETGGVQRCRRALLVLRLRACFREA